MTPTGRSGIENGIWLCSTHSVLIDRDAETYPEATIVDWKLDHEARVAAEHESGMRGTHWPGMAHLVAIGPAVVAVGCVLEGSASDWVIGVEHFVEGDLHALAAFVDSFASAPLSARYVLSNELGDGRVLARAPSWRRSTRGVEVSCSVLPRAPRKSAHELGGDFALGEKGDLVIRDGDLVMTSGLDSLRQRLTVSLSRYPGDSTMNRDYGTRIGELVRLHTGSPWHDELVKLEVVRMASVPYCDDLLGETYLPLGCVDRVVAVSTYPALAENSRLPVELKLEVNGVGTWANKVQLFLPPEYGA